MAYLVYDFCVLKLLCRFIEKFTNKRSCVARMPIFLVFEFVAAGFIAGSIPIKGISYLALSSRIALVVAVLQATTMSLQFISSKSVFFDA
jgi:hypothetical protein